jgi:26S proteasome regulatory subunit N1
MAFQLARQQIHIETDDADLNACINNTNLSRYFLSLARELDVMEPKVPEDIYKSHLENHSKFLTFFPIKCLHILIPPIGTAFSSNIDSARTNLSSTFVNAFVNAAFCKDKLMITDDDNEPSWIHKTKEHGMISATASLGLICLWDIETGLSLIDKYMYSNDDHIKAGALLAIGILNSGVREESDPALALLSEHLESNNVSIKQAVVFG